MSDIINEDYDILQRRLSRNPAFPVILNTDANKCVF